MAKTSKPKLFATSIERYYGGIQEKRKYGGTGAVTVFLIGEKGSDASTWKKVTGHGKTPGERKTDALRRYQAGTIAPPAIGILPAAGERDVRDGFKGARPRRRGRGLGYTPNEHLTIGRNQLEAAEAAYIGAEKSARSGHCPTALSNLDAGGRAFGQAQAHLISTSDEQNIDTNVDEDRLDKLDGLHRRAQHAIQDSCLRPRGKR